MIGLIFVQTCGIWPIALGEQVVTQRSDYKDHL